MNAGAGRAAAPMPHIASTVPSPITSRTVGVMGGGQLGRMFVHAAQTLGCRTVVLDPDADSPAGLVSHVHLQAAFDDAQALRNMGQQDRKSVV